MCDLFNARPDSYWRGARHPDRPLPYDLFVAEYGTTYNPL